MVYIVFPEDSKYGGHYAIHGVIEQWAKKKWADNRDICSLFGSLFVMTTISQLGTQDIRNSDIIVLSDENPVDDITLVASLYPDLDLPIIVITEDSQEILSHPTGITLKWSLPVEIRSSLRLV